MASPDVLSVPLDANATTFSADQERALDLRCSGLEKFEEGEMASALADFQEALLLLPNTPQLQYDCLRVAHALGHHEQCISDAEHIIEHGRKHHADFEILGSTLQIRDASLRALNVPPALPKGFLLAPPGPCGRFVTCSAPYKQGETLFDEKPISTIFEAAHFAVMCHGCKRPYDKLTPCTICSYARFCDKCLDEADHGDHVDECSRIAKLRLVHSFSNEDISLGLCILRLYNMILTDQSRALQLLRLQSHREDFDQLSHDAAHHYRPALMAGYLLYPPTIVDQGESVLIQGNTPPWVHENLVTLSAINQTNSYRFRRFGCSPPGAEGGVFLQLAMFNHSCNPNCRLESENGKLHMTALRDISPGEEITTNYLPIIDSLQDRHEALKKLFFFDCSCGCTE